MIFRRDRFGDLVRRQLDLFAEDEAELLEEAEAAERAYDRAERDEAEEAYGDYQLVLEAVVDRLEELRDTYAATLDEETRGSYEQAFGRAARRRFPNLTRPPGMTMQIEDYALIGDLQTAALVGRNGSIDWLCLPRFDSGACFAALLGDERNGRWLLAPDCAIERVERRYRDRSLVHELDFHTEHGVVRVTDFMPPRGTDPDVVRIVEGIEGAVPMRMELVIRFDYGSVVPWVHRLDDGRRLAVAGPDALCLDTPIDARGENLTTVAELTVSAGERVPFVLTWFPSHRDPPRAIDAEHAFADTCAYWTEWLTELHLRRPLCRRGLSLADGAEGDDVFTDGRARRRPHHLASRAASAACATGTIASAGCATPPSR